MIICFPHLPTVCLLHLMVHLKVPPHQPCRDALLISMINATEVIKCHRLSSFFGDAHAGRFQSFIVISNVLNIRHVCAHVFSVGTMSASGGDELKTDLYQTWQNHSFFPKQICRQESTLPSWVHDKWNILFLVTIFLVTEIVTGPGSTARDIWAKACFGCKQSEFKTRLHNWVKLCSKMKKEKKRKKRG